MGIFKYPMNISGKCTVFANTPAYLMDKANRDAVPGLYPENANIARYRMTQKMKNY